MICSRGHVANYVRTIPSDGGHGWFCYACDHQFGWYVDGGVLDIGTVPALNPFDEHTHIWAEEITADPEDDPRPTA